MSSHRAQRRVARIQAARSSRPLQPPASEEKDGAYDDGAWCDMQMDLIREIIKEIDGREAHVTWCIEGIEDLDVIAAKGPCLFSTYDADGQEVYQSAVWDNPTWLEIAFIADESLDMTGDLDHHFLEGVSPAGVALTGEQRFTLQFGS